VTCTPPGGTAATTSTTASDASDRCVRSGRTMRRSAPEPEVARFVKTMRGSSCRRLGSRSHRALAALVALLQHRNHLLDPSCPAPPDEQFPTEVPPHCGVTFGVDDADATAARATELGATVMAPPFDAAPVRLTCSPTRKARCSPPASTSRAGSPRRSGLSKPPARSGENALPQRGGGHKFPTLTRRVRRARVALVLLAAALVALTAGPAAAVDVNTEAEFVTPSTTLSKPTIDFTANLNWRVEPTRATSVTMSSSLQGPIGKQ
jgi:hypothetical protein